MTEAIEQARIDAEVRRFKQKIALLNKQNKFIVITGFKLQINRPAPVVVLPWWVRMFKKKETRV